MKPHTKRLVLIMAIATLLAVVAEDDALAQANNPVGQWTVSAFNDATPNLTPMAVQTLCFRANGTWYGTFPGWRGSWFQKGANVGGNGNRVRLLGNFLTGGNVGAGNDSAEFDFISANLMTAPWNEWIDVGLNGLGFGLWVRISAVRTANNCTFAPFPPAVALSNAITIEQRMPFESAVVGEQDPDDG